MKTVRALATVKVPATRPAAARDTTSDKGSDKSAGEQVTKWARKKEKMTCYRCGEPGHFLVECTAELCDLCLKPKHGSGECPLLLGPKPAVTIYGVCYPELMFFESPHTTSVTPRMESSRTGVVKVTRGSMTEVQVVQQLRELVSASFQWAPVRLEDQVFRVDFPTREDLARLLKFGLCKVPNNTCVLEFDAWTKKEPQGLSRRFGSDFQGHLRCL